MRLRSSVLLVLSVCCIGGCQWGASDGRDRNPDNRPGYYLSDGDRPIEHRVRGDQDVTAFQLISGADVVRVRVADLAGYRYEISTPDSSKVAPVVSVDDRTVVTALRDARDSGPAVVDVVLDDDVRWQVRLAGGASEESVDLTGGPGGDVDFSAGTSRAAVTLPAGSGTQRVVLGGGASVLGVRLAGNAPARVAARGGAGSVTIDGQTRSGIAGGTVWDQNGWSSATDRFDIDATAGVSTITVERAS
jgi:hypothetical protein